MLGYLSADIICSEKRTVFPERSSRKTVSFEEQIIISKDKYPSIFSPQMDRGYYPSNLFRNAHSFENWGYLTIRPAARKRYEAKPNGLLTRGP